MTEYKIFTKAELKVVKQLWKEFFQKDSKWHFTLEGDYIEIRAPQPIKKLEDWLKDKKLRYQKFPYHDNIPITRKYQKQFEKIFHGLSELSMVVSRKGDWVEENSEVRQLVERCVHLTFNIFGYSLNGEVRNMASLLIDRAYFMGSYMANMPREENKKPNVKVKITKEKK